jgi:sec-independent protein translocase protein TatA
MFGLDNPIHILFLLGILLLIFGAKRLPEMGRSLGTGMRGFKESLHGDVGDTAELGRATQSTASPAEPVRAPASNAGELQG